MNNFFDKFNNIFQRWQRYTLLLLIGSFFIVASPLSALINKTCDIVIVGGGPSGLYTAYKLATLGKSNSICLFEKKDHFGGRAGNNKDIGLDLYPNITEKTGGGAYRLYQNQYTFQLGLELQGLRDELNAAGYPVEPFGLDGQISFNRLNGIVNPNDSNKLLFTYEDNPNSMGKAFKDLYNSPLSDNDLWHKFMCGPWIPTDGNKHPKYEQMAVPNLGNTSTAEYLDFMKTQLGITKLPQYFRDVWRFKGDFDGGFDFNEFTANPSTQQRVDLVSYLDSTSIDFVGGLTFYAVPSYDSYFDYMAAAFRNKVGDDGTCTSASALCLNETVTSVNQATGQPIYVKTSTYNVKVAGPNAMVFIAADHNSIRNIYGNIIDKITARTGPNLGSGTLTNKDYFESVMAVNAVTVSHQWEAPANDPFDPEDPDDDVSLHAGKAFWNFPEPNHANLIYPGPGTTVSYPLGRSGQLKLWQKKGVNLTPDDPPIRRQTSNITQKGSDLALVGNDTCTGYPVGTPNRATLCDFSNKEFLVNTSELALGGIGIVFAEEPFKTIFDAWNNSINVSRTVYVDQPQAVRNWVDLYKAGGEAAVTNQILKQLRHVFPNVFTGPPNEPKPVTGKFLFVHHKPAWHFLKEGSFGKGITNLGLLKWSQNPLRTNPETAAKVFLIGDAWNNHVNAWTDGAYKSSIYLLNKYFNTGINPKDQNSITCINNRFGDPPDQEIPFP